MTTDTQKGPREIPMSPNGAARALVGNALPDYTTDHKARCEWIGELEKQRADWQLIANDHIIAVRTITEQLQSMHDAWEEQANALVGNESEPSRRKRSHDNGYAGALFQTAAEVSGLLKSIRSWPPKVRPYV